MAKTKLRSVLDPGRYHWFIDHPANYREGSPRQNRKLADSAIEQGGNKFLVVLVAGIGFFTDSYLLFANNATLPVLSYIYWRDSGNTGHETAINSATLAGCIVGMVLFGVLGDLYGRRKMFGYELIILIVGTAGVVMSSTGQENSMNIESWLIFWRFVCGIGLGGDYPSSAVIVSESAPKRRRARMLASVFFMQALGILAATLVSMVVVVIVRNQNPVPSSRAVDQIWRWIMGLGLVPAALAVILRLTIPESPRYTMDGIDDPFKAFHEMNIFNDTDLQGDLDFQTNIAFVSEFAVAGHKSARGSISQDSPEEISTLNARQHLRSELPGGVGFGTFFWTEGNWRVLLGTALTWFLLDFSFYGLGFNNPWIVSKIWYIVPSNVTSNLPTWDTDFETNEAAAHIFSILIQGYLHSLVVVSLGAVVGGAALVLTIDHFNRKRLQWGMFLILGLLLIITGATFQATVDNQLHGVTVTLYVVCQICFYLGPNSLTFIIPAELFPTKFRTTCHGISAASGKLGSVIAQLFLAYVRFVDPKSGNRKTGSTDPHSRWLGYVLLVLAVPMFLGAVATWLCIPELQSKSGDNLTLGQLSKGRRELHAVEQRATEQG